MNLIKKIGIFRLVLTPLGLAIITSAIIYKIIGMGIVGLVVLVFGLINRCLLLGKCDVDSTSSVNPKNNYQNQSNSNEKP